MWCLLRLHVIAHGAPRYQGNTTLRASGAHFQYNPFDGALCIIAWDGRLAPMAAAPTCPRLDRRELVAAVLKEGRPASLTACVRCYGWMARRAARQRKGARAACSSCSSSSRRSRGGAAARQPIRAIRGGCPGFQEGRRGPGGDVGMDGRRGRKAGDSGGGGGGASERARGGVQSRPGPVRSQ